MKGSNVGRLNVYTQNYDEESLLLWRLAGSQDNAWKSAEVTIDENRAFKVRSYFHIFPDIYELDKHSMRINIKETFKTSTKYNHG